MFTAELDNRRKYVTLWELQGRYYVVSSVSDSSMGISETMIFESSSQGVVINWSELFVTDYTTNHQQVIDEWITTQRS